TDEAQNNNNSSEMNQSHVVSSHEVAVSGNMSSSQDESDVSMHDVGDTTPAPQTPENQVVADEPDLDYLSEQTNDELNSGVSSIYEDEDEENSLDGSSDEEDII
ncbi:1247_t:CDS:2, partial [Ambispora leptoticha]